MDRSLETPVELAARFKRAPRNVIAQSESAPLPWYIGHLSRNYQTVMFWLHQRNIEAYYPMMREIRPVPRRELSKQQRAMGIEKVRPRLVPLLTSYMFVRIDRGSESWRDLFETAGIAAFVSIGGVPIVVSQAEIDRMRGTEVAGAIPGTTMLRMLFREGDQLRLKDGPLADFPAVVEQGLDIPLQALDANTRIIVAVHIFGQATRVTLHPSQVERA